MAGKKPKQILSRMSRRLTVTSLEKPTLGDDNHEMRQEISLAGYEFEGASAVLFHDMTSALGAMLVRAAPPEKARIAITKIIVPQLMKIVERSEKGTILISEMERDLKSSGLPEDIIKQMVEELKPS